MKIKKNQNWPKNHPKWHQKWKKWPQKWKIDLKNENFEKNGKFWKSSDNLEEIKNLPKNSPPPNDLKTEKFT